MINTNKVILSGNLTNKPTVRKVPVNYIVTEFAIAINGEVQAKDGAKRKTVVFIDIVTWGKNAVDAADFLDKGNRVEIEGRLQFHQWTDKITGKPRTKHSVVADHIIFFNKPNASTSSSAVTAPTSTLAVDLISPIPTEPPAIQTAPIEATKPAPAAKNSDVTSELPWYHKDSKAYTGNSDYDSSPFDDNEFSVPYRDEELTYRDEINHDEWKDKVSEYNSLLPERERADLSHEDHERLEDRLQELSAEIKEMHDFNHVAENLPPSR